MVITLPDKGSGILILDKTEYATMSLLKESSITDEAKLILINLESPKKQREDLQSTIICHLKRRRDCPPSCEEFFRDP